MNAPNHASSPQVIGQRDASLSSGWRRVFVAEDDREMRELVALCLTRAGYEVVAVESGAVLLDLLAPCITRDGLLNVHMIITDIRMPGPTGLRTVAMLREYDRLTPVIVMTAFGSEATRAEAMQVGATMVIDKPVDLDDLCSVVRRLVPLPV